MLLLLLSQRIERTLENVDTTNCTEESIEEFNALFIDEARDVLENATDQEEIAQMIEALKECQKVFENLMNQLKKQIKHY